MGVPLIGTLIELAGKALDRVLPDPQAKAAAQLELLKLAQAGEFKQLEADLAMATAQADINKIEAASADRFVSGWRPFIGWTCGAIFAANYIGVPFLAWVSPLLDIPPPPRLDIGEVLPVLVGLLGLGTLRTKERLAGKA